MTTPVYNHKAMAAASKTYDTIMKSARKARREAIAEAQRLHDEAMKTAEVEAQKAFDAVVAAATKEAEQAARDLLNKDPGGKVSTHRNAA